MSRDTPMPWCASCSSYHAVPMDMAHWVALQCKAPLQPAVELRPLPRFVDTDGNVFQFRFRSQPYDPETGREYRPGYWPRGVIGWIERARCWNCAASALPIIPQAFVDSVEELRHPRFAVCCGHCRSHCGTLIVKE